MGTTTSKFRMLTKLCIVTLVSLIVLGCTVHQKLISSAAYIENSRVDVWPIKHEDVEIYVESSNAKILEGESRLFLIKVGSAYQQVENASEDHSVIVAARIAAEANIEWKPLNSTLVHNGTTFKAKKLTPLQLVYLDEKCRSLGSTNPTIQLTPKNYACARLVFDISLIPPEQEYELILGDFYKDGRKMSDFKIEFRANVSNAILR